MADELVSQHQLQLRSKFDSQWVPHIFGFLLHVTYANQLSPLELTLRLSFRQERYSVTGDSFPRQYLPKEWQSVVMPMQGQLTFVGAEQFGTNVVSPGELAGADNIKLTLSHAVTVMGAEDV